MILLDTNVISELTKIAPSANVLRWLNGQVSSSVYISAVTVGEIEYGLRILPDGRRRRRLKERFERFVALAFAQRVLGYDEAAARLYGDIMGLCRESGRAMSVPDGQIAAIARSHRLSLATRNTKDFAACGVELINPFDAE